MNNCVAILLAQAVPLSCLQLQLPSQTVPAFHTKKDGVFFPSHEPIGPLRRQFSPTSLNLLKGLVPSVDDDIRREIDEAGVEPFELFKQEIDKGASIPEAIATASRRRKDKAGDYENKYKILSDYRSYSNRELLDNDHLNVPPSLDDLNQKPPDKGTVAWVTLPYRIGVLIVAFLLFPAVCSALRTLVVVTDDEFDIINDQFTPGIGILYGTFVALTLDILYERQGKVQENASVEASLLSQVTQNVINLFQNDIIIGREAAQAIADQVRIIVYRSRGSEMLSIMRADPYARLLSIVDHYQRDKPSFTPHEEALIDGLRSEVPALMEARAKRLSDEASTLPPTHFVVLKSLTALSLVGFTAATLTITDGNGDPPLESRAVFAGLSAIYVLFYNFCRDMNDPFEGVYQIKRSSAAAYLLQIKWLIANQPYGENVKFDTRGLAPVFDVEEMNDSRGRGDGIGNSETGNDKSTASEAVTDLKQAVTSTTAPDPPLELPRFIEATSSTKVSAPSPRISPTLSETVINPEKKSTSKETSALSSLSKVVFDPKETTETQQELETVMKASTVNTPKANDVAIHKVFSATDFLPALRQTSAEVDTRFQSNTTQEETFTSQFESVSGFRAGEEKGEDVTVTPRMQHSQPNRKPVTSMHYF